MASSHTVWRAATALLRAGRRALLEDGQVLVTRRQQVKRLIACYECPYRDNSQCGVCRCYLLPKTAFATEQCPKGAWSAV